jgi:hypothetical protein
MIVLPQQEIIDELVAAHWPLPLATRFATTFPPLHNIFAPVVNPWRKDRTVNDIVIYDCSLHAIMRTRQEHFLVCLRHMHAIYTDSNLDDTQKQQLMHTLCQPPVIE